jgi:hypothetical protein
MASGHRNLFLYLTLVCFFGLITIFIVDGYMGVYDTLYITAGEREQKIEFESAGPGEKFWSAGVNRGEKAFFRYEVDNRQFSRHTAQVEVSVWRMQEKVLDILSQPLAADSFAQAQLEWVIDPSQLLPADAPPEQGYEYTIKIKRGEVERNVILFISPAPYVPKPPLPVR